MNNGIKFSRQDFLKKAAATGFMASASIRSFANSTEKPGTIPSSISIGRPHDQDKKFVPVMITPFQQNGKIDLDGVSRLIDFYLASGVKGFFANCASSAMYQLTEEERLTLTQHVVKRVNGVVPVVATGSFGSTIFEQVEFSKKIY